MSYVKVLHICISIYLCDKTLNINQNFIDNIDVNQLITGLIPDISDESDQFVMEIKISLPSIDMRQS